MTERQKKLVENYIRLQVKKKLNEVNLTSYYNNEIKKIENDEYISVQFHGHSGITTKYVNLNEESIPIIIRFLNNYLKKHNK